MQGYQKGIATIIGATVVHETQVASPFVLSQLQSKADAIVAARELVGKIPYRILTFRAVDSNRDVASHLEAFDVGTPADVANDIYADDKSAEDAATKRYTTIAQAMGPYTYVALYIKGTRFTDHYEPPTQQSILDTTTTKKGSIWGYVAGIGGALGLGFLFAKRKRHTV